MIKLNELSQEEMSDVARHLQRNRYDADKFDKAFAEFIQIKKSVLRHRVKLAKRVASYHLLQ